MPIFVAVRHLARRAGRHRAAALIGVAALIVIVGAALFSVAEHVGLGTALYWAITTATTVGYGDVTPHNTAGRIIAGGVMLTTIPVVGAVFALFAGTSALARFRRILGLDASLPTQPYTVIYGSHPVVRQLLEELGRTGDPVVLVAQHRPAGLPQDVEFVAGNPAEEEAVRRSRPEQANRALIACTSDADTLVVAVALHHHAPDLEVFALTQSPRVARALDELGVAHTLASDELVGHTLAKSLETPQAGGILLQLVDTDSYEMAEQPVEERFVSRPLSQARAVAGALVLGISREGHVDLGVGDDPVLAAGDRLIVLTPAAGS